MVVGLSKWVASLLCWALLCASASSQPTLEGTIIFSSYRRLRFAFDIFSVELPSSFSEFNLSETRLTYGHDQIVNYNGFFASNAEQDLIFKKASLSIHNHLSSDEAIDRKQGHRRRGCLQKLETASYGDRLLGCALQGKILAYVSEQEGRPQIYFNRYSVKVESGVSDSRGEEEDDEKEDDRSKRNHVVLRQTIETAALLHSSDGEADHIDQNSNDLCTDEAGCVGDGDANGDDTYQQVFFHDRPSIAQGCVIYVSSQGRPEKLRQSWAAVYSTNLTTGLTQRLTPIGVSDFSPSVSPSGKWVMVASYGNRSWDGEADELSTDLYIFNSEDGSSRMLLVKGGGWPSWADDSTFFFHRKAEDGWWSIYKGTLWPRVADPQTDDVVTTERVTPAGVHCFTPAASATMKWVAIATRRPESDFRHIEIYDLESDTFVPITNITAPTTHHYNPFVSHDSRLVAYHKCRGGADEYVGRRVPAAQKNAASYSIIKASQQSSSCTRSKKGYSIGVPHLASVVSPSSGLAVLHTDGEFPSFSPDGSLIAYIRTAGETGVRAMRSDGSRSVEVYANASFTTVWDPVREGVIYTSSGPIFHSRASVHIVAIFNAHKLVEGDDIPLVSKALTKEGTWNNAFPSPSPNGRHLVFRSSRSGWKNLYIMDAVRGEEGGLWRVTEGKWTDTMCSWSPDGEWIVFSSDRDSPKSGSFQLYMIHPNGTGLRKVLNDSSVAGGRANHASFSPDSKSLLFTSDYAGLSSEPISIPFQFQPYGDIFVASVDGKYVERVSHAQYENGTPSWGSKYVNASELTQEGEDVRCVFNDVDWLGDDTKHAVAQMPPYILPEQQAQCGYVRSL